VNKPRRLKALADVPAVTAALAACGFEQSAAQDKATLIARAAGGLLSLGADGAAAARVWLVPGRIEVLGKHTDYAGGHSIVAAVDKGFCMVALPHDHPHLHLLACDLGEEARFDVSADLAPPQGHWTNYPMTVVRRLARNFPQCRQGASLAF
jgi:galactokinase